MRVRNSDFTVVRGKRVRSTHLSQRHEALVRHGTYHAYNPAVVIGKPECHGRERCEGIVRVHACREVQDEWRKFADKSRPLPRSL